MKVKVQVGSLNVEDPSLLDDRAILKFSIARCDGEGDSVWTDIASIVGRPGDESYGLKVEDMYNAIKEEGGKRLVIEIFNLGLRLSPDLGMRKTEAGYQYAHGLENNFEVGCWDMNKSAVAVHFVDYCLRLAEDTSEVGMLDFEAELDCLIDSLRKARAVTI
jgi:hypothetical protein